MGAGENTHDSIATHDTYTLGQFKDDQLQNHVHYYSQTSGSESGSVVTSNDGRLPSHTAKTTDVRTFTNWNVAIRTGTTTHGKQKGVNFIIKY